MLNFVGIVDREGNAENSGTITIDGYSTMKTVNGTIKEVGRYIAKNISELEGNSILQYPQESLCEPQEGGYFFTIEDVGCASQLNDDTDEMEYKEGNYYFCICIAK